MKFVFKGFFQALFPILIPIKALAHRISWAEGAGVMKTLLTLVAFSAAALLAGCGHSDTSASSGGSSGGPQEIDLTANDTMHYNQTDLTAKGSQDLKVVLTNEGNNPITVMGHNWVLLKPGSDYTAFATAAAASKDTDYMPASLKDEVVASIPLQGPRKSGETDIKAGTLAPGQYPFLCTFPGHFVNMHGTLTVQ
ncbi:MAG TPA: plastocyanin/azurin family copper-binding protein [Opitutaceae bacterium]|jgi:azurin